MKLLRAEEWPGIVNLFTAPYSHYVADSAASGNLAVRVWVDDDANPAAALMWEDRGHCIYLAGEGKALAPEMPELARQMAKEANERGLEYFKFAAPDEEWSGIILARFKNLVLRPRVIFALRPEQVSRAAATLAPGWRISPIDRDLVQSGLKNMEPVIDEISGMWPTVDRFLEKSFGYVVRNGDTIASWCTTEYLSDTSVGIGVETVEEYQNQGFSTAAVRVCLQEAARRGLTAHWDAWERNTPSVRVAEKAGFTRLCDYNVLLAGKLEAAD
jgi:RimJ/RimL family protein N-acetyltransferase